MSVEEAPRHITPQPTLINEEEVPLALKGRLQVNIINEKPPGENLTGSAAYDVSNYTQLTVLCGDLSNPIVVHVKYLNYLSYTTFKRQDGCIWYMCHTWTRTWGQGALSGTTFINLETGDRHDVPSLSFWRGNLQVSPDGNLILIEAGIMASSDRQLLILDITNLPAVDVIHKEYFGYGGTELSDWKFNEKSEFECTYLYFFQVFKDKIKFVHYFGSDDKSDAEFTKYVYENCPEHQKTKNEKDFCIYNMKDYEGGLSVMVEATVKRKRNENRPITNNFGNLPSPSYTQEKILENSFFADIYVNEMIVTETIPGEDFDQFKPYMKQGLFDISSKRCIFCTHQHDYQ